MLPLPLAPQVLPPGPAATVGPHTEEEIELAPYAAGASPERLSQGGRACLLHLRLLLLLRLRLLLMCPLLLPVLPLLLQL